MTFFAIYAADVVDAARALAARAWRRKSGIVWFALLFAGSVWLALRLAEIALTIGLPPGWQVTTGTLLFLAFFVTLAKGAVDAYHRAIRPDALVFLLVQPTSRTAVALGKFFTVLWFNLAFLAGALALAVGFVRLGGMRIPLAPEFAASLVLAVVAGLASGFALAVLGSLAGWRRKVMGLGAVAPIVGAAYVVLVAANPSPPGALLALGALAAISAIAVPLSGRFLVEAWNNQTSGRRRTRDSQPYLRLPDPRLEALLDAELKTLVRKRQAALSLATVAILGIALLILYATLGPPTALPSRFAPLFYPIVIAAAVYVAATTQLTVPGLAALGKELDRLWIPKSLPVRGADVYRAKSLAILVFAPVIVAVVALPLPLVAGFPWTVTAFLVLVSLAVCLALAALGVHVGARSPNFDPNTGGMPDSIAMYNVFLAALVVAFLVAAIPTAVYQLDKVLGLLAAILTADVAALLAVLATRGAGHHYDRIEA